MLMVAVILLVSATAAEASVLVEPALRTVCEELDFSDEDVREHCTYQYDGGSHGSASNDCDNPSPTLDKDDSDPARGFVAPVEDPEDNYALDVASGDVGDAITVTVEAALPWTPAAKEEARNVTPLAPDLQVWAPSTSDGSPCAIEIGDRNVSSDGRVSVKFTPSVAGTYTLRVFTGDAGNGGSPLLPGIHRETDGDPFTAPARCHPMCVDEVNALTGYALTFG